MTAYESWNLIIQGVIGFGTLVLASIAIWGNLVRSWLSGPKLKVRLLNPLGELITLSDGTPVRYYHLKVTNGRRKSAARNVEVLLTKIFQPAADGSWVDRSFSGSLQLTWQFPLYNQRYPLIGPDRVCDLGCMVRGQRFNLTPYTTPNNFTGFVEANQSIRVEVVAAADNGESKPTLIEIVWNGRWSDEAEEMRRYLVVKEVTG
jgi:hypothetical protein